MISVSNSLSARLARGGLGSGDVSYTSIVLRVATFVYLMRRRSGHRAELMHVTTGIDFNMSKN